MAKPSNFDELYPGRFLKAGLFKGKKPTLTITDVDLEELEGEDNKKKAKAILTFAETKMQLVACKTNGICLRELFGKELANWIGKRVTLFADQWNGEECIRIWGSPELAKDRTITITLPRRRPVDRVIHSVKAAPQAVATQKKSTDSSVDPRTLAAWDILGWTKDEGRTDREKHAEISDTDYLNYLNGLIDQRSALESA